MATRKRIVYIGFYSCPALASEGRAHCLAATNKMDYICDALVEAGYDVLIVSPSWSENGSGWYSGKTVQLGEHKAACFCPTFGSGIKLLRVVRVFSALLWLFAWLLLHARRGEKVIAYHTPWLAVPLLAARSLKWFTLVLEVEEIYQEVGHLHPVLARQEKSLIRGAHMYLLANDLMPGLVGASAKRHAIVYGAYRRYPRVTRPPDDGRIHLVYAGVIDAAKGGAPNAVAAAEHLDDRYALHILGFGDTVSLKQMIRSTARSGGCEVAFEGLKSGDDFISFMQTCHIGLSTQRASGTYVRSSFPSKVLSYLSFGLRVVSAPIECVVQSNVGDLITYYSEDTPEAIADAIRGIHIGSHYDPGGRLAELHEGFVKEIGALLEHAPGAVR